MRFSVVSWLQRRASACIGIWVVLCTGSGMVSAKADEPEMQPGEAVHGSSHWRVSGGVLYRRIQGVEIRPGRYADEAMVPTHASGGISGPRASVGSASETADRSYDDGFVNRDPGTPLDGDTWYWGYQNAGQVDGEALTFHASDGISTETHRSVSLNDAVADGAEDGAGLMVELGYDVNLGDRVVYGVNVGLMVSRFSVETEATTFRLDESWSRHARSIDDTYDLQGVTPPPATYNGTVDGPGPLIANTPANRTVSENEIRSGRYQAWNSVSESVDLDLLTLSLAPSVSLAAGPFSVQGQAGPALNVLQVRSERSEVLLDGGAGPLASWYDASTDTSIMGGFFVKAGAAWYCGADSSLGLGCRYDWMADGHYRIGPSSVAVNPEGLSATVSWIVSW